MQLVTDLFRAHHKLLFAVGALLLVQLVDKETLDWAFTIAGSLGVLIAKNDPAATKRIYKGRLRNERGEVSLFSVGIFLMIVGAFIAAFSTLWGGLLVVGIGLAVCIAFG